MLEALRTSFDDSKALVVSALIFMIFHVQAQPLYTWPHLFAAGIQYGALRLMGVSLVWLIIAHAAYDTFIFYLESSQPNMGYFIFTMLGLALTCFYWNQRKAKIPLQSIPN